MHSTILEFPNRTSLALAREVDAPPSAAERRAHQRLPGDELAWLAGMRLKYGPAVRVIDVSRGGIQIETVGHRLNPGTTVVCEIAGAGKGLIVPAQVLRCHIAQLTPEPSYRGSLAFKRLLEFPDVDGGAASARATFNPAQEYARLTLALRKAAERRAAATPSATPHANAGESVLIGTDALNATLALLHAPAGRRSGEAFSCELAILFRTLARGVDADFPVPTLIASLEDRLVRAVGVKSVRLTAETRARSSESICFAVPGGQAAPSLLLVEFHEHQQLAEWHFHLLRAAVHLFALVRELDRPVDASPAQRSVESAAALVDAMQSGQSPADPVAGPSLARVVVRYMDGRVLKGYSGEFTSANEYIEVLAKPDAPAEARIRVPFGPVKAIFFVRDFDGDPNRVDEVGSQVRGRGRALTVTFLDDEVLSGTTMNYRPDGPGFFLTPGDAGANNERVFVVSRAIRHVRFG